jgi:hypothetical protein
MVSKLPWEDTVHWARIKNIFFEATLTVAACKWARMVVKPQVMRCVKTWGRMPHFLVYLHGSHRFMLLSSLMIGAALFTRASPICLPERGRS